MAVSSTTSPPEYMARPWLARPWGREVVDVDVDVGVDLDVDVGEERTYQKNQEWKSHDELFELHR